MVPRVCPAVLFLYDSEFNVYIACMIGHPAVPPAPSHPQLTVPSTPPPVPTLVAPHMAGSPSPSTMEEICLSVRLVCCCKS